MVTHKQRIPFLKVTAKPFAASFFYDFTRANTHPKSHRVDRT
jgi:hypothetical protein